MIGEQSAPPPPAWCSGAESPLPGLSSWRQGKDEPGGTRSWGWSMGGEAEGTLSWAHRAQPAFPSAEGSGVENPVMSAGG